MVSITGLFEPIEIDGTMVSRAYLHNLDIFEAFQFGIGDTVSVYKANMIIPQIAENKTKSNTFKLPMECPCCGVSKNMSEAVKWYRMAARQGNTYAQSNLKNLGKKW